MDFIPGPFFRGQEGLAHGLFPPGYPGPQGVFHKFQRLLLDVGESGFFQIPDHMRRYPEDSGDLINLELPGFQELCLVRRDPDRRVLHAFFQDSHFPGVGASPELGLPGFPDPLRIFDGPRMLQDAAGRSPVGKELGPELLTSNGHADGVLGHGDG